MDRKDVHKKLARGILSNLALIFGVYTMTLGILLNLALICGVHSMT